MAECAVIVACSVNSQACDGGAFALAPSPEPPETCPGVVLISADDYAAMNAPGFAQALTIESAEAIGAAAFVALATVWAIKKLGNSAYKEYE